MRRTPLGQSLLLHVPMVPLLWVVEMEVSATDATCQDIGQRIAQMWHASRIDSNQVTKALVATWPMTFATSAAWLVIGQVTAQIKVLAAKEWAEVLDMEVKAKAEEQRMFLMKCMATEFRQEEIAPSHTSSGQACTR